MDEKVKHFDIRAHKKEMRDKYKQIRRDMPADIKKERDNQIFSRLVDMDVYKNSTLILAYVSTGIEVDTIKFIEHALKDNKTVAVPRCIYGTRNMDFYIIKSVDDLEEGSFSVLEPVPEKCEKLKAFDNAFCIVPALVYDSYGYRLGYGKGYYDRFLSAHKKNNMYLVGIGYCCCMVTKLIHGYYDVAVNTVVTEKYVKRCIKEEVI